MTDEEETREQQPNLPKSQGLLKRNPETTLEQFSESWIRHAAIVLPYFLSYGLRYYAQQHGPLTNTNSSILAREELIEWDGAAESIRVSPPLNFSPEEEKWRKDYYQEVILADEKRFLVSSATEHIKVVPGGTVVGKKVVVIEDGKSTGIVESIVGKEEWESILRAWGEYEARAQSPRREEDGELE